MKTAKKVDTVIGHQVYLLVFATYIFARRFHSSEETTFEKNFLRRRIVRVGADIFIQSAIKPFTHKEKPTARSEYLSST